MISKEKKTEGPKEKKSERFMIVDTHTHYDDAMTKLQGKGGAISYANQLKAKGAKVSKQISLEEKDENVIEFNERVLNE